MIKNIFSILCLAYSGFLSYLMFLNPSLDLPVYVWLILFLLSLIALIQNIKEYKKFKEQSDIKKSTAYIN